MKISQPKLTEKLYTVYQNIYFCKARDYKHILIIISRKIIIYFWCGNIFGIISPTPR